MISNNRKDFNKSYKILYHVKFADLVPTAEYNHFFSERNTRVRRAGAACLHGGQKIAIIAVLLFQKGDY